MIFTCVAGTPGIEVALALVTPFRTISDGPSNVIGMRAVREGHESRFILLDWIVRAVYLQPTFDNEGDWYVNDIIDVDSFLLLNNHPYCT
jgi:hypothetical protein